MHCYNVQGPLVSLMNIIFSKTFVILWLPLFTEVGGFEAGLWRVVCCCYRKLIIIG